MLLATTLFAVGLQAAAAVAAPDVSAIFRDWTVATPGCAVGVEREGQIVLEQGFGMADLERGIVNKGDTIFEAGSVSKQFTAAAVLLLVRDGKLSLDDPIRKHMPELPDSAAAVTVRQMLQHTSGLRDWGSLQGIAGWPRTTRAYTHGHVLDILSRQTALNFPAGTRWSYSNSGYNLAAMLVQRLSGQTLADFSRERIFNPLGMTRTSWRDDHTRVVPGRALAYSRESDGYHLDMPFENVYGNGGLLTTVGDLLRWARQFREPVIGDREFLTAQITPGRFADGRVHDYGLGVWVRQYRGVREVRHSGSTAGYRAYLTTFPDQSSTVAVLCNAANASAENLTYRVVDQVLSSRLQPATPLTATHALTSAERDAFVGLYRDRDTGVPQPLVADGAGVRIDRGAALVARGSRELQAPNGDRWTLDGNARITITDTFGGTRLLERVQAWSPSADALRVFAGRYASDEIETELVVALNGSALEIHRRPDDVIALTPVYENVFTGRLGTVIFRRDATGRISDLTVSQDRVWALSFRAAAAQATRPRR
ncbi:MAG: beta-lactamase family protein [Acidobacteria bacterium]|nr:beta-lactamase family protein [Acidobacteriota bacterium]